MANPRRTSFSPSSNHTHPHLPISTVNNPFQNQTQMSNLINSLKSFLKKPHAFPFLLSLFLFLTWVSLRFQRPVTHQREEWHPKIQAASLQEDKKANLLRFKDSSSSIAKDKRGWLLNPISLALDSGISGGAAACASIHLGEIRSGGVRGNHRHHTCNETFVIWGAKTVFRLENDAVKEGYAQVVIGADEVAVIVSPHGTAHALVNVDPVHTTYFIGCQDSIINYNDSSTDLNKCRIRLTPYNRSFWSGPFRDPAHSRSLVYRAALRNQHVNPANHDSLC